jgi:hypothetical protein
MELQALRRSQRVPESCRDAAKLRECVDKLRSDKNRLWAEIEALPLDCALSESVLLVRVRARLACRKQIAVATRKWEKYQKYLAILENREIDPSMNQIL